MRKPAQPVRPRRVSTRGRHIGRKGRAEMASSRAGLPPNLAHVAPLGRRRGPARPKAAKRGHPDARRRKVR